jgi:tRNA threonylcarbamoyladenosine biosynthesis protein TsaE
VSRKQPKSRTVVTRDPSSTRALAGGLASAAAPGDLVSLIGDLGAGKTQFAKGFGAGLGIEETIVSPTFVLMAEYTGRLTLFHVDLYRLADAAEAMAGGLVDDRQSEGVTLIEWAERLADAMPEERLEVILEGTGDEPRRIELRAEGKRYERYLAAVPGGIENAGSGVAPSSAETDR